MLGPHILSNLARRRDLNELLLESANLVALSRNLAALSRNLEDLLPDLLALLPKIFLLVGDPNLKLFHVCLTLDELIDGHLRELAQILQPRLASNVR